MNDDRSVLVTSIVAGGIVLVSSSWWLLRYRTSTRTGDSSKAAATAKKPKPRPPMAPVGMLEMVAQMSGPEAPFYLLNLARRMQRNTFALPLPFWNGAFLVGDGKLAREMYAETDKAAQLYKPFEGLNATDTMFTHTNTAYMRSLRKGTAHAFSRNEVGRMNAIAQKHVQDFITQRLADMANRGESFDPAMEMNRITFRVICESACEYDSNEQEFQDFMHHSEIALKEFTFRQSTQPWRGMLWTLLPGVREAIRSANIMKDFARKVLEAYQSKPDKSDHKTLVRLVDENPVLQGLHDKKVAELNNWLIAGHDTTGYTLSNMLVLLAKHTDKQEKLRKAVSEAREEEWESLPYLQWCLKETQRIMPTAAMGSIRLANRDYVTHDDFVIPKGAILIMVQSVPTHAETVFEQPEAFIPERWENPTQDQLDHFYPFALGPRNCPGRSLAMSEINSTIPRLLREYRFELVDEGTPHYFLTLKYAKAQLRPVKL